MLCAEIMKQAEEISPEEWNYFLRGAGSMDKVSHSLHIAFFHKLYLHFLLLISLYVFRECNSCSSHV